MNAITLLTNSIGDLWFWTYGLVAGWGVTFTLMIAAVIFLAVRILKLTRKINALEQRLVHAERDYNISVNKWK